MAAIATNGWNRVAIAFRSVAGKYQPEAHKTAMKKILLILLLVCSISVVCSPLVAQDAKVTSLMSKPLSDIPGKELLMIMVEYPPGSSDPIHRHNAQALVYVLKGSIVMGVNGEKPVTLTAGQTFYEGPNDIHTVGHNASKTMPAKFLVVLLKPIFYSAIY